MIGESQVFENIFELILSVLPLEAIVSQLKLNHISEPARSFLKIVLDDREYF